MPAAVQTPEDQEAGDDAEKMKCRAGDAHRDDAGAKQLKPRRNPVVAGRIVGLKVAPRNLTPQDRGGAVPKEAFVGEVQSNVRLKQERGRDQDRSQPHHRNRGEPPR